MNRQVLRILLLSLSIAIGSTMILLWVLGQIKQGRYMGDYNVFWGIAEAPIEYVYARYHFAYPPTALLLIRPFGLLEFWWAYAAWISAGVLAMVVAARRMVGWDAILFGFISYAGIGVIVGGQTSLFVGALIVAGLTIARAEAAGVLLGIAAAIKPQSLLAAPIALIASRNYRAIAWAAGTGLLLLALSLLLWGVEQWVSWLTNLHHFPTYLQDRNIDQGDKGLHGLALQLGLPRWLYFVGIPLGAICVWKVFRSAAGPLDRYAAFATGTILMSPYTLDYDLVGLTIAAVGLLFDERRPIVIWVAAALIITSFGANIGVIMLAIALTRRWWRPSLQNAAAEHQAEHTDDDHKKIEVAP